ncbi:MAG: cysteine hydrolase [Opitutaceae bacterium]|jgi:nicotinamidase-related amidase|nr:cysteine hydrolase [Opitutaceae bacterium]
MSTVHPSNVCLLVVDVQKQFVIPATVGLLVPLHVALDEYSRSVFSRLVPAENSPVVRWKGFRAMPAAAPGSGLAVEPPAVAETLVTLKTGFSALTAEAAAWMRDRGVRAVHVCGMDTDLCVTRTLYDVMEAGFEPGLRADLCASSAGEAMHAHGLAVARRMIGRSRVLGGAVSVHV